MTDHAWTARRSVFILEDDLEVARIIRTILEEFGFYTESYARSADLYAALKQRLPDLCIIDLMLPDADGMDVVRTLADRHDFGMLILTCRSYLEDRVLGLELGADDYVLKPFDPRELVARVRSILRRCSPALRQGRAEAKCARFAGWSFHAGDNRLSGPQGRHWVLSTAEARLLQIFLDHPRRILAREQLCGARDLSPFDRSVDVRVSRLRRKLEVDPERPRIIKTVYGAGYLLAAEVEWDVSASAAPPAEPDAAPEDQ
ncbi:MAG: response regulator transcription factor [Rhodocyclaceae bacterium]|nr:response regulator transcription factor [Rhodocyclaceae bacterium]MBX3668811.1 response regulator transcription factor [Rhodocyclaceae bacterium]